MVFSSTIFLFFFLPITLFGYFILRGKARNYWLFLVSVLFYLSGGISFFPIILYTILLNYAGGRIIDCYQRTNKGSIAKLIFVLVIAGNLLSLGYWKYCSFFLETVNQITGSAFRIPEIILPIGISFFTFQGMSYVIDVYKQTIHPQKNLMKFSLYIMFFSQLIEGPIVAWLGIFSN